MRGGKIIAILCAFFLSACRPVLLEETDMDSAKQFVNAAKGMESGRIVPLPEIKPVKPLPRLVSEPFRYNAPTIIDDWHKRNLGGRGEGRGHE